jgi:hypothetical protein
MRKPQLLALAVFSLTPLVAGAAKPTAKATKPVPAAATPAASCKAPAKATCAPGKVAFQPATTAQLEQGYVRGLTAADVNNDGKADLIAMHEGLVEVLLSAGDGTFTRGARIEMKSTGYPVVAADLDGDCNTDVLVNAITSDGSNNNLLGVLPGKGNGTFKMPATYRIGGEHLIELYADDFNGDHKLDFAYRGNGPSSRSGLVLAARGKLGGALTLDFDTSLPWATGDLTGDGSAELVYMKKDWGNPQLCVLMNNGNAQFADPTCIKTDGGEPDAVRVADVTGDHKADVVLFFQSASKLVVYVNDGKGAFDDRVSSPLPGGRAFALVDANNDGSVDVVAYEPGSTATVHVLKNDGQGHFAKSERYAAGGPSSDAQEAMAVGDFLGNGLVGFAVIDRSNNTVGIITAECR